MNSNQVIVLNQIDVPPQVYTVDGQESYFNEEMLSQLFGLPLNSCTRDLKAPAPPMSTEPTFTDLSNSGCYLSSEVNY